MSTGPAPKEPPIAAQRPRDEPRGLSLLERAQLREDAAAAFEREAAALPKQDRRTLGHRLRELAIECRRRAAELRALAAREARHG